MQGKSVCRDFASKWQKGRKRIDAPLAFRFLAPTIPSMNPKAKKIFTHYGIGLGVAILAFCLVFFLRKDYGFSGYCDAFFVCFALEAAWPGLVWIHRQGTFDVFHYGMSRFLDQWTHHDEPKYANAGDYEEAQMEKRRKNPFPFWTYLSLAGVFLMLAILFLVLVETSIH